MLEYHVDPTSIRGTGKDGRLTKDDVIAAAEAQKSAPGAGRARCRRRKRRRPRRQQPAPQAKAPRRSRGERREERVKMSRLRQTIAKRLKEAQNTAAMLTTFNDVDMSAVIDARARYKDLFEKKHGIRLGFMGFFVKACALAAKDVPSVNASLEGDEIVYHDYLDVSVAVSAPKGLVVPVVRNADSMSFAEIEKTIADYRQARQGRHADHRRDAGRHLHHLQRRRVRLAAVDPDHQPAAVGGARHAPDRGAAGGQGRPDRRPADDVSRALATTTA